GRYRFLVIWYVVALTATGLFFVHDRVASTRMQIVLPAMAAFAGIAVDRILIVLEGLSPAKLKPLLVGAALVVLVPLVFALNIQIFWVDSPRGNPGHPITVAVRAVMETPCRGNGASNVVVSKDISYFLEVVFRRYGMTDEQPMLLHYEETSSEMLGGAPCVVLMNPGLPLAQGLLEDLLQDDPARSVEELRDGSGSRRVLVVRSANYARPVLQFAAALLPEQLINQELADVNLDGEIDAVDAELILQFEAGLLDSLPVGG
ncbi:MAG: hypothetical protein IH959_05965, partial [Chloroflexi bacterium]|nr:hypothetical protein [Chloroflexota bacterium]